MQLFLSGRKFDGELGTFTQPAMHQDGPAHLFDGVFDDRQAQACSA